MEQYVAGVRVLQCACARGALAEGEAAARFLYYRASTLRRHPALAFRATDAAARYASLAYDRHRALTVSLATAGMELTDTLELRARTPPRALVLPGLPTKVFVYATGAGCATVQGTISYSTYIPKPENSLLNVQAAIIEEIRPERSSIEDLQGNLPTLIIKTCFKWKGKERSGILRLESSLFSGYELRSVNPVVLDGATFADLHYGSRGESVWFVFANISSTCPVCVTYEARSKFVITSLRPAFAKIYPSSRPDLAVETFFHARPGSPLLKGITDDDFITWFDKTQLASLKTNTNIDNICECGRICSRDYEFRTDYEKKHPKTTESSSTENISTERFTTVSVSTTESPDLSSTETNNDVSKTTTVGILDTTTVSTNHINDNTTIYSSTEGTTKSDDPIIIPTVTYINQTDNQKVNNEIEPVPNGELIIQKVPVNKSFLKKSNILKKPLPRRKGTLKATYGDKHEKFFIKSKPIHFVEIIKHTENNTTVVTKPKANNNVIANKGNVTTTSTTILPIITTTKVIEVKGSDKNTVTTEKSFIFTTKSSELDKNTTDSIKNMIETTKSTETSTMPHTITTITKSNIKNIHYRTKKPKPKTQIKKPLINTNDTYKDININTTKDDTIIKSNKVTKHISKPIKSINKEIHKIPSNPISETDLDKSLNGQIKIDIAPENKGGFEILDKNNLWELLKDPNNAKIDIEDDKSTQNNRSL